MTMLSAVQPLKTLAGVVASGLILLTCGCNQEPGPVRSTTHLRMMDDTLIQYNKGAARTEDQEIRDFAARYGWDMVVTPSGLRYLIYKPGDGRKARSGETAVIKYQVSLLNGRKIYSSDSLGLREFFIGQGDAESGLQEAMLLMKIGDRAKIIIPSRLGYGLLGDGKRIPPGSALVYDVELTDLKKR